jgi:tripartite-type tricarboxylate transporter receptor subunit TctC
MLGIGSVQAQMQAGQVRALAVAGRQRLAALPAVPTLEEAGLSGYDVTNWFGVLAPKGTPRDAVQILNTHIGRIFDNPDVVKRFADAGALPMKESPEAFQKRILDDDAKWRDVVKNAGVKAE